MITSKLCYFQDWTALAGRLVHHAKPLHMHENIVGYAGSPNPTQGVFV